ncbi:anhydro-N-acetylmuramic acid kinase [Aeromonas simiae]|uniref:anhydro-N-acetylmuramic acid kinase n=1 Tax=Aeromonas simiae TaxID=218936 RepID=UPI0005AB2ACB|nr:anhydro-N-acetylmuramic acid kinase [Aeromonas simiae]MDO2949405.1 anhydro-N-acetylmuramic acid kinase [Aeromonas simiae]MDO2952894.1 anhydro-N-acetylmuramic acid kinase [Aeromonas simiae]MDO2956589.1 anhydro-N-acetylmuramic acid kinase [Aeromonas simiae]
MIPRYIGLMSGTSMDGIDAVLLKEGNDGWEVESALCHPWAEHEVATLHALCTPGDNEIDRMGVADNLVAECFATATHVLLEQAGVAPTMVRAIGSHGQTIRHRPELGFTLQIGNGNLLAARTGIDVVADFRRMDMALGGQGAPLVPAFHQACFGSPSEPRVVLNIGGIANISVLPGPAEAVYGFDTGPGNTLLDGWYRRHYGGTFDASGAWAAQGKVHEPLLLDLLTHPYFAQPYPKSTGRETFTAEWLDERLAHHIGVVPADVQRTLLELTARSIADALPGQPGALFICGGGAHNPLLLARLAALLPGWRVADTSALGIHPDWVEGAAFAWLAHRFLLREPGNLPAVTGARRLAVLGTLYPAP